MDLKNALLVAVIGSMSVGCAAPTKVDGAGTPGKSQPLSVLEDTSDQPEASPELRVVFRETCPSGAKPNFRPDSPDKSVVGTILIGAASYVVAEMVGSTVDAVGKALSSNQAITFTSQTRVGGFANASKGEVQSNARLNCMVVVASRHFGGAVPVNPSFLQPRTDSVALSKAIHEATGLSGPALFYLEATIEYNDAPQGAHASTAFTYVPRTFYYPEFIAPRTWRYSSTRDVLLKVEFAAPGQAQPFASFDLLWSGVKSGGITEGSVQARTLPWSLVPSGLTAAAQATKDEESPVAVFPVNVSASFTETAKPRMLLKHLGDALTAEKANIVAAATSEFKQAVSSEARAIARAATAEELGKKYEAYATAYDQAVAALAAIPAGAGSQRERKIAAARIAYAKLSAAETLARKAYQEADVPFDTMDPLEPVPESAAAIAAAAKKKAAEAAKAAAAPAAPVAK